MFGISHKFSPEALIAKVTNIARQYAGKPIVIVFPEAVLGEKSLPRTVTKATAQQLSTIANEHGQLLIGYSVIEKGVNIIINAGYLIQSHREPQGYQVYAKATTYRSGREQTVFDEEIAYKNGIKPILNAARTFQRARRIKSFPTTTFNGQKVMLQICADSGKAGATTQTLKDTHHFDQRKGDIDLLLVPAAGLTVDLEGIRQNLKPEGKAIVIDRIFSERVRVIDHHQLRSYYSSQEIQLFRRRPTSSKTVNLGKLKTRLGKVKFRLQFPFVKKMEESKKFTRLKRAS